MLEVVFWDVQHGSSTYIKTPAPKHLVQDLGSGSWGSGDSSFSPFHHLYNNYGLRQLDEALITHPHADHLDDIVNFDLLSPININRPKHLSESDIWAGNQSANEEIIDKYLEINKRYNRPTPDADNPEFPQNNGGVTISIFQPYSCGRSNLNNHSLVTVISYLNCKIILPGDNEPPSWNELLERSDFTQAIKGADIFLAPHHGRQSGYCVDLFSHFRPLLTVISDGPYCDTSATSRYDQVTTGWSVHSRSRGIIKRKCVTTRNDGVIVVKAWRDPTNGKTVISVEID